MFETIAGYLQKVATTGGATRCILLLVCASAAVNILLYSLALTPWIKRQLHVDFLDGVARNNELGNGSPYLHPHDLHRMGKRLLLRQTPKQSDYGYQQNQSAYEQLLFTFSVNNYTLCDRNASEGDWDLVIVVISKASHFSRRHTIRNTWGSELQAMNSKIVYLVGKTRESGIERQIHKEFELYQDIIQVDLLERYRNLTRKSISMLQWLTDYCQNSRYYLKADDDMYINVENVIHELKQRKEERFFFCHVFKKAPAIRQKSSKWFISVDEFTGEIYPTYCSGTAYAYSSTVLVNLHQSAIQRRIISLEDVYITGIAAESINVTHLHSGKFSFYKQKPTGCTYEKLLAGHEVTKEQMFVIHSQLKSKEKNKLNTC